MKQKTKELIHHVKDSKAILKAKNIKNPLLDFSDSKYGKMYRKDHLRITNLWNCLITDEQFAKDLREYAEKTKPQY